MEGKISVHLICLSDSSRLRYALELLLGEILGLEFQLHLHLGKLPTETQEVVFWYGVRPVQKGLYVPSCGLLDEKGLERTEICVEGKGKKVRLFPLENETWPDFDLFSAAFWLVSRYEEFLPGNRDGHGRFAPEQSLAYRKGFLAFPMVNIWGRQLGEQLEKMYPWLEIPKPKFSFLSTVDVDNGFKFEGKPLWRNLGGLALDLMKGAGEDFRNRKALLLKKSADPYDAYGWVKQQLMRFKLPAHIFVLATPKGPYDHGLPPHKPAYKKLMKRLKKLGPVSLHPSYASFGRPDILEIEKRALAPFLRNQENLQHVRRHFLKMNWPNWFYEATAAGFSHDYSMGYASVLGYRAGVATSFFAFDPRTGQKLPLRVHPFGLMETVFRYHSPCSYQEAKNTTKSMMQEVQKCGGTFISIWHDRSFANEKDAKPWKKLYQFHLRYAVFLLSQNPNDLFDSKP